VAGHVVQQGGLAHARFTVHYQSPALTGSHGADQLVKDSALRAAVLQL
jgi:hypothetical protein